MTRSIVFCVTSKTGLGHLRRATNVALELCKVTPNVVIELVTNGTVEGLAPHECQGYAHLEVVPRDQMTRYLRSRDPTLVVVDTAIVPDLCQVDSALCLILRETTADKLGGFRLGDQRLWDLVLLPNPRAEWRPDPSLVGAQSMEAVGWIYRKPNEFGLHNGPPQLISDNSAHRQILIASGGGGSVETACAFRNDVERIVREVRQRARVGLEVIQAVGPRVPVEGRMPAADRYVDPGSNLHELFPCVDMIISTVGYNSILELACTDVPVLLLPAARTFDDQTDRARSWGTALGFCHQAEVVDRSVSWMVQILEQGLRRPVVDLGPSGASRAAALLQGLLQ